MRDLRKKQVSLTTSLMLLLAALFLAPCVASAKNAPAPAPAAPSGPTDVEKSKVYDEAVKALNGFHWNLEVAPMAGKKEDRKTTKDVVIFKDNKLSSEGLAKQGYGTSNFTLTVGDDLVPVFETMQRNATDGVVFWRGELVGGKIRGVISVQVPKQPAESFGFHGERADAAKAIPAEVVEKQPEPKPETVVPPVTADKTKKVAAVADEAASDNMGVDAGDADLTKDEKNAAATPAAAVASDVKNAVAPVAPKTPAAAVAAVKPSAVAPVVAKPVTPPVEEVKKEDKPAWGGWWGQKKN